MLTVDVLIPVYRPGRQLSWLLERLKKQSRPVQRVILMNTEREYFPEGIEGKYPDLNLEVYHLSKDAFDHGGTRDEGIRKSSADIVICMTQDVLPADRYLVERLTEAFEDSGVWAAYARQLPAKDCGEVERYTRKFNYPEESRIKEREDLEELGVKTYFCSNVCAAWRREAYLAQGASRSGRSLMKI